MSTINFKDPITKEWIEIGVQPSSQHAETHAAGGTDELTPEMIGAPTVEEMNTAISEITPEKIGAISKDGGQFNVSKSISFRPTATGNNAVGMYFVD
jgi:hypothetical protein